jgi:hypothetical protein
VLALAVSRQNFQTIPRRRPKIFQTLSGIKLRNFLQRRSTKARWDAAALAGIPQQFGIGVREASDHSNIITLLIKNGKRY